MVYNGGGTCSLKLASIKRIPCKQPDNSTLAGPSSPVMWLITQVCLQLITQADEASLETTTLSNTFGAPRKSHSNSSSRAVIHLKCVAGDDLFKHMLTLTQTHRKRGRDGECDHVCVRLRGSRWAKDVKRVISFHTEPSIISQLFHYISLLL